MNSIQEGCEVFVRATTEYIDAHVQSPLTLHLAVKEAMGCACM